MKRAIFISCSWNYVPYLNALLNSIDKRGLDVDVYLLHDVFTSKYLDAIQCFDYHLISVGVNRDDFSLKDEASKNRFMKFARYEYMPEVAKEYDVGCLLDADMMIVSSEFQNLFDLVAGTDKLIACNEKFKWGACKDPENTYILDDKPLFPQQTRLWKFHCNVPIIFDMKQWSEVFDAYVRIASEGYEIKQGKVKKMGDIFAWNCAVQYCDRQNDVILFPMETMTQVHYTNIDPERRVLNDCGYWHTTAGDPVYTLHGRVCKPAWEDGHWGAFTKKFRQGDIMKLRDDVKKSLDMIKAEWYNLSYNHKVKIEEFWNG